MCGSADLQVGMVINVTTTFITHILPLTAGKPVSPEGMCLFGEMLCEHLQCRLESRPPIPCRLQVGAPDVRERRPPGRHGNKRYYYLYHPHPTPAGWKAGAPNGGAPGGGVLVWGDALRASPMPAGKPARPFHADYKSVRPMCGSADLQVGMVINVTTTFITHILPLPTRKPVRPEGMCLFGEMLCEHLQCRLESRRAYSRPATSRCARCAGAPTSRSAW